ncbi:MAG: hypothetical protein ACE5LH_07125, partial [Fidelibacterota bacterium]
ESEFERGDEGWTTNYEILYGLTPDVAITLALPYHYSTDFRRPGVGDVVIRGKYRFIRRDILNASDQFAVHTGAKLPSGNRAENLGSGTTDFFVGVSFGHESRVHYAFAGVRYRVNGSLDDLNRGDVMNFDVAYGIRPWQLEYTDPDPVFLVEVLGRSARQTVQAGIRQQNTGGLTLGVAPGILFSYRNVMLKLGAKLPLLERLNGSQPNPGREFILAIDIHMPPLK